MNSSTKRNIDDNLVLLLNKGSEEAFKKLYLKYIDDVYRFVISICKSHELSKDVCHDIFMMVWEKRNQIDSELSFKSFLFSTSKNHVLNIIKRASKEKDIHEEIVKNIPTNEQFLVEQKIGFQETDALINQAVETLPPRRKQIYELSRNKQLSHIEIAQQLGISKGTVNVQLVKALKFIKKYLSDNGVDLSTLIYPFSIFM